MTCMNLGAGNDRHGRFAARADRARALQTTGVMPAHVFLRLFLAALSAVLAIHFWKQRGR